LYYTASGIITPVGGRPVHGLREEVVQYFTRDYSELTRVYSKKDTSCGTGKWWPISILIEKCVSFTAVSIIFVYPLYILPCFIPWSD